jgi:hypothetical protein
LDGLPFFGYFNKSERKRRDQIFQLDHEICLEICMKWQMEFGSYLFNLLIICLFEDFPHYQAQHKTKNTWDDHQDEQEEPPPWTYP